MRGSLSDLSVIPRRSIADLDHRERVQPGRLQAEEMRARSDGAEECTEPIGLRLGIEAYLHVLLRDAAHARGKLGVSHESQHRLAQPSDVARCHEDSSILNH